MAAPSAQAALPDNQRYAAFADGQTTQHYIQQRVLERSKDLLSTTPLSIAEIVYQLGFEHPQSFSKLFKSKTHLSPLAFRATFN
jgi:AraC-like DNA-binding protein